jgi:hypothetical protein
VCQYTFLIRHLGLLDIFVVAPGPAQQTVAVDNILLLSRDNNPGQTNIAHAAWDTALECNAEFTDHIASSSWSVTQHEA